MFYRTNKFSRHLLLLSILLILVSIYFLFLFKNISYPLLWNDEADTAIYAQQILRYGYPKVHDGKNIIFHFIGDLYEVGVKEKYDAYIGATWGQFYFAFPWVYLAEKVDNLYLKTAIIRAPFALMGFFGVYLIAVAVLPLFAKDLKLKLSFLIIFTLFEISSVNLFLHLRQARYMSLTILLQSLLLFLYLRQNFFKKFDKRKYLLLTVFSLILLFNIFYPVFLVFVSTILLSEFIKLIKKAIKLKVYNFTLISDFFKNINILPLILSFIILIPEIIFFEIPLISSQLDKYFSFSFKNYLQHIYSMFLSLAWYEQLLLIIVLKIIVFHYRKQGKGKRIVNISNFLGFYSIIYLLVIAKSPYIFTRYFIPLQPVLILIFTLDLLLIFKFLFPKLSKNGFNLKQQIFYNSILTTVILTLIIRLFFMKDYILEISKKYFGPLDVVITYILSEYDHPENLVIATNYEEEVFMYYLNSRVIVGFAGVNIQKDLEELPDLVLPRKRTYQKKYLKEIYSFLEKGDYEKRRFNIFDNQFNNIPELVYTDPHLFQTTIATSLNDALEIYEKKEKK